MKVVSVARTSDTAAPIDFKLALRVSERCQSGDHMGAMGAKEQRVLLAYEHSKRVGCVYEH